MDLIEKSRGAPTQPGVYLFRNPEGAVIYVGKAKDLRARLRTYFMAGQVESAKTGSLLREAAEIETIVVDTEAEALALENSLIKRFTPRFNILLRDDKTYPYIRLTRETYPRVYVTRRLEKDGAEYYGPFFPAGFAYRLIHFIHKHFLVPSCRVDLTRFHPRPCLQFHIRRCLGPCVEGLTTADQYGQAVSDVRLFLAGRQTDLARDLRRRRDAAAAEENFEAAARYRDLLTVLDDIHERQKMHAVSGEDADIVGFHREGHRAALNIFHLRHGRVVDRREYFWEDLPEDALAQGEPIGALLKQIYLGQPYLPPRITVPADFEDRELLAAALAAQRGGAVEIAVPQRGGKKEMIELAEKNAALAFARRFRALTPDLAGALGLAAPVARVECFDVSHFQGAETVASMVVWEPNRMKKSDYRKFKIKTVDGVDDFRSVAEAVSRRYSKAPLPDLVLIDGGIGQLHAARRALDEMGFDRQPLASLAKREELIYVSGRDSAPLNLDRHSPELRLLQAIRDEAHRFAITFHRDRRGKATLNSELLEIPGVGPATVRKLLQHFGSLTAVRAADVRELATLLPQSRAESVWQRLHSS
ncbi:MAG TPA: excinuclease ABC subunit UvrC [Terriglobales bacterium]|nr:excinuclease ABC subunit UvrC [Terriglobales bacterium]